MDQNLTTRNPIVPEKVSASSDLPVEMLKDNYMLMRSQVGYHTAVKAVKERDITVVREKFFKECEAASENFFYSWEIKTKDNKKKQVEGKSYQLARALMTAYGNCVCNCYITGQDTDFIHLVAEFIDLENGVTQVRPFMQRKNILKGKGDYQQERVLEMALGIGVSKNKRNVIFDGIPGWIAEEGFRRAKESAMKSIKGDLAEARNKVVESFELHYQITKKQLEAYIDKEVELWASKDILSFRTLFSALRNGEMSIEEFLAEFEAEKLPEAKEEVKPKETPTGIPTVESAQVVTTDPHAPETVTQDPSIFAFDNPGYWVAEASKCKNKKELNHWLKAHKGDIGQFGGKDYTFITNGIAELEKTLQ